MMISTSPFVGKPVHLPSFLSWDVFRVDDFLFAFEGLARLRRFFGGEMSLINHIGQAMRLSMMSHQANDIPLF